MTHNEGVMHTDIEHQLADSDEELYLLYGDEHNTASCSKDPWWNEAIKVADDIENKQKPCDISNMVSS